MKSTGHLSLSEWELPSALVCHSASFERTVTAARQGGSARLARESEKGNFFAIPSTVSSKSGE